MIDKISIIFPIYNEQNRINELFSQIKKFLDKKKKLKVQLIFINDGSKDNSLSKLHQFSKKLKKKNATIKVINFNKNYGKGFAISQGVKSATNEWILTSDVDLSVSLNQLIFWEKQKLITPNYSVYIGSRVHKKSKVKKIFLRHLLGVIMGLFVKYLHGINFLDTQCGFKLYKKNVAKKIFKKILRPRFEHDVEIILKLRSYKIKIKELPVKWKHKKESKVNIFLDPIKMFFGILILKLYY